MSDREDFSNVTRDDLVQRLALMESMIAEGRRATTRFGWVFVLWGTVNTVGIVLQYTHERANWPWPVTLGVGVVLQCLGIARCARSASGCESGQSRSISAVWMMMGLAAMLYFAGGMLSHHTWQVSYLAGMLTIIGLAHAISALLLRWRVQGLVAALWWIGAGATFFVPSSYRLAIFTAEMFFGFLCFGLYAMMLDRRASSAAVSRHG